MSPSTKHFVRHYLEMVVAMFIGMGVLGLPLGLALGAAGSGWSELHSDAPALALLAMAATMTVPMVGWMAYRGHGARANAEMSAAMFVPTFAAIALLWSDVATDIGLLMAIEHVAMLASMLAAMLLRPADYVGGHRAAIHA
jgi:hypothetical protein